MAAWPSFARARSGASLAGGYDELTEAIPRQEQLGSDETSIQENGKKRWIWCITAATFSVFHIAASRSREVLEKLVGPEFAGHLNLDYFSANCSFAWNYWIKAQYCWAHLIRAGPVLDQASRQEDQSLGRAASGSFAAAVFGLAPPPTHVPCAPG